jgi:hypothetical protein
VGVLVISIMVGLVMGRDAEVDAWVLSWPIIAKKTLTRWRRLFRPVAEGT